MKFCFSHVDWKRANIVQITFIGTVQPFSHTVMSGLLDDDTTKNIEQDFFPFKIDHDCL